jgi:hypothetical protein
MINSNSDLFFFETSLKRRDCNAAPQQEATSCSRGKTLFRVSCSTENTS